MSTISDEMNDEIEKGMKQYCAFIDLMRRVKTETGVIVQLPSELEKALQAYEKENKKPFSRGARASVASDFKGSLIRAKALQEVSVPQQYTEELEKIPGIDIPWYQLIPGNKLSVYAPTNRGLRFVREEGLVSLQVRYPLASLDIQEVRGEEIPDLVLRRQNPSEPIFGITGQDLLEDTDCRESFGISERDDGNVGINELNLARKGPYKGTLFGLPTLCLLSRNGKTPEEYLLQTWGDEARRGGNARYPANVRYPIDIGLELSLKGKRVVIPQRYKNLIDQRIPLFLEYPREKPSIDWVMLDGQVDVTLAMDSSLDYAIDIVLTGKTLREKGLGIERTLFFSDGVLLQNGRFAREKTTARTGYDTGDLSIGAGLDGYGRH